MAISDLTRRRLQIACGSVAAGDNIVSIIDADGGTMSVYSRGRMAVACGSGIGSGSCSDQICDAIDADGALSSYEVDNLRKITDGTSAVEINTEQGS